MSTFRLTFLWLMWHIFRWPSVVLIDHDEMMHARLARGTRRCRFAKRMAFGIADVRLMDDGTTRGKCYVHNWEPLFPPVSLSPQEATTPEAKP